MDGEVGFGAAPGDAGVEQARIFVDQRIGILADRPQIVAHPRVDEIVDDRIVDLDIAAAERFERRDLLAIDPREIVPERVLVGIGPVVDRRIATVKVDPGGRGDRDLGGVGGLPVQEGEVVGEDVARPAQPPHGADVLRHIARCRSGRLPEAGRLVRARNLDPFYRRDEVDPPVLAAELAVGHRAQPQILLQLHDIGDGLVLHPAQLGRAHRAGFPLPARFQQFGRAQQAADVIGAEQGFRGRRAHRIFLRACRRVDSLRAAPNYVPCSPGPVTLGPDGRSPCASRTTRRRNR